ncbi:unnamed protein product [Ilex paraguariensis]|uniref:Homeobox-leucine zipper protein n=1 Tax=Ilex paraguariensis TaxID=185542 RepID=A0ABC8THX0_9AQUA
MLATGHTSPTTATDVSLLFMEVESIPTASLREKKKNNKRRFSHDQIRLLESMFNSESRPEQWTKKQLASMIGLQPRQVAIWFQNRRARSKSKQIERDYNILKISYDTLASKFDSLKKENQSLLNQLEKLTNLMGRSRESRDQEYESQNKVLGAKKKPNPPLETHDKIGMPSCNEVDTLVEYFEDDNCILNMADVADGFLNIN